MNAQCHVQAQSPLAPKSAGGECGLGLIGWNLWRIPCLGCGFDVALLSQPINFPLDGPHLTKFASTRKIAHQKKQQMRLLAPIFICLDNHFNVDGR